MHSVLLFYKLVFIQDPKSELKRHREVCKALQLLGRILLGHDGINATLSGSEESLRLYREYMNQHRLFKNTDFKQSLSEIHPFPKLKIKVREEIITTETRESFDLNRRGKHIDRDIFHEWLKNGEDMVLLDMRNDYEWEIGRFVNSIRPPMKYFRDLKDHIEFYKFFKDKKIVMFCTGGIRCEPASAFFIAQGFDPKNLYQLEGGIVKYAEKYGDEGFYEGKCFVFDERMMIPVNKSPDARIIGRCLHCEVSNDIYRNCANKFCNRLFISCDPCNTVYENTCSKDCKTMIENREYMRPPHAHDIRALHRNK
ncbi:MAG: rhodanese-related sulfurtransferase [Candidatus Magasanikbacteria bacterium]|nr:rhodanese-related sulfurtransferase [Candidatus Magasanikbacteria bacterium]